MSSIVLALLALGQAAGGAAATAAPAGAQTLQQRFDQATQLAGEDKCAEAVAIFDAVAPRLAKSPVGTAALRVRKGKCLIYLDRGPEGAAMIRASLPVLAAQGASFNDEVIDAHLRLAREAHARFDYDAAAADGRAALALSTGTARLRPLMLLADTLMFDHDGKALAYAQEARAIALADQSLSKKDVANVQTIYARVLMNEGRDKEAYAVLKDSLAKRGGLTSRVGLDDVATRSDLAIAALRNKDMDNARQYLAYTGAGRMADAPYARAVTMKPPICADVPGLTPQDVAIVEYSLANDGRVVGAVPIFTTGKRAAAIAFAQAVSDWSWRSDDVKAIKPFFRLASRVELRCLKTPSAPSLVTPLADATEAWITGQGVPTSPPWADLSDAAALPLQRAAMNQGAAAQQLATLFALSRNAVVPADERAQFAAQALTRANALHAPTAVRTFAAINAIDEDNGNAYRSALRRLLADPQMAADPLSAATLRVLIAVPGYRSGPADDAPQLLDAVIAEPNLPERHPLKVAAMLQQANVRAAKGDLAGAKQAFAATGLTAEQCSLLGITPGLRSTGTTGNDFPMAAQRYGFEGWVSTEFDISADGRTIEPRAVIAYPPFVFDEAATGILRDSRFTSSFRPEGALACAGRQQAVVFRLP
ncbi:TonB protein C-terminal [Sphingomonas palmae]|uniref:TonB protein C-terminal n=1 Tax=Sphingomonas palmae TaxID=1855283 RepID=A0A1H7LGX1_9SPHN|nr:energy transducer TonB [Sphingomonas palmae]SEK97637.1 TonB protein C-terminal [Sphingomonas palmae]